MIPFVNPQPLYLLRRKVVDLVRDAGLISSLQMCFDPGDRFSYPGSGQTFFDVSGNGYQMTLGTLATPSTDDPTFNGRADGQSSGEFFSFDGGDILQLTANDTFVQSLHKLGASFTFLVIAAGFTAGSEGVLLNTKGGARNSVQVGTNIYKTTANFLASIVGGVSGGALEVGTVQTVAATGTQMLAVGRQLISTTNRVTDFYINGVWESKVDTASATLSTSGATAAMTYGVAGDGGSKVPAGHALSALTMFNRRLTQAELDALRTSFKRRWPSI
ncbi:hypothetical protein [Mesorhizobium erdmanii]|uniref:LamG domain-containing protein n=1 Tax=Mesorhizobium erdmanii TaxID=1777866 RepID=A0A6M7ULB3_9HYPH|nr:MULTISPECIES: hypothetical protein [Mesorhizobium]OBQ74521.1 hypothetical protein A8146_01810 [Mesorhizobium loti]QKC76677.1 hypothetical protein EB233_15140 [Mesorhizobium erdmanii]